VGYRQLRFPKRCHASAGDFRVLIFRPSAYADGTHAFAIHFEWNPAANRRLVSPASNGEAQREQNVHFLTAPRRTGGLPPNRGGVGLV